jgi:[protein-PII] uridylyltransferase
MPDEYLRSATTEEVLWHLQLIDETSGESNVGVKGGSPVEGAAVVGRGRPGFRHRTAEAFAANGIDVLEARLFSRSDGLIVDTYRVRDDRIGGPVRSERWDSFRADLEAGLEGKLDTSSKMVSRAGAYEDPGGDPPLVRASLDAASGELVIVVKCADRIGRLAEILGVLTARGLEIRLAQIDSREDEAVDTFHVGVVDAASVDVADLEAGIARAIRP